MRAFLALFAENANSDNSLFSLRVFFQRGSKKGHPRLPPTERVARPDFSHYFFQHVAGTKSLKNLATQHWIPLNTGLRSIWEKSKLSKIGAPLPLCNCLAFFCRKNANNRPNSQIDLASRPRGSKITPRAPPKGPRSIWRENKNWRLFEKKRKPKITCFLSIRN